MTVHDGMANRRWRRDLHLLQLPGKPSYPAYLKSAGWADVKARYRASGLPQDCICGETEHVHLHHLTYERVGHEELADLTPLCASCHAMIHVLVNRGEIGLDFTGFVDEKRAERYREQSDGRAAEIQAEITDLQDEYFGPFLRAMGNLRMALDATSLPQGRKLKREAWLLRKRLVSSERRVKEQMDLAREQGVAG